MRQGGADRGLDRSIRLPGGRRFLLSFILLSSQASPVSAQLLRSPEHGGRTFSLGQPPRVTWHGGVAGGAILNEVPDQLALQAYVGVSRPLFNPVAGAAALGAEAYAGLRGSRADGGARVLLRIPYAGLGAGVDYSVREGGVSPVITAYGPFRRGGMIVPGGLLRADVYPNRRAVTFGLSFPLGDRFAGRRRPILDHVVVATGPPAPVRYDGVEPEIEAVLDSLRVSAEWIRRLVVPFLDHDGRDQRIAVGRTEAALQELRAHLAVRSSAAEVRHFHAQLERACALAAGSSAAGAALARSARTILLDEVVLPYNRLLGRKKKGDTLEELAVAARGRFSRVVAASDQVPDDRVDRVLFVFQRVTQLLDDVRRRAATEWDDARLVWLPLQYALLPEDHDEQHELDGLLERATAVPATDDNEIQYVANLQFHWELLKSIRATRDYHVLWVHDFPAVTPLGTLDSVSYMQVVEGYLTALAERVEAYDSVGTLPSYFIFLDEFYYQARRSRILMNILEDPLGASARLPRGVYGNTDALANVLARLHAAVAGSRVLHAETRQYGDAWLRNRIKVHVSITNRVDPSFWSGSLFGTLFGYPDNVMRDHRKLAFRDVSDADPRRGLAILTGMGVGEQYLGPSWEDRSLIVRGPMLLALRDAVSELLVSQGLPPAEVPLVLRGTDVRAPPDAGAVAPGSAGGTRAVLLVNGTGYLEKPINVAKALLYSLLPAGCVIKIPDSLWNSTFFGGLLTGAVLRGCTVSVIAPAPANAPSSGFPQMTRAHELLTRLLLVRRELAAAIADAGGELRVGLYALPPDRDGFTSRLRAWTRQVEALPRGRAFGPAHTGLLPVIAAAAADTTARAVARAPEAETSPKLHKKVQYLATGELWDAIVRAPEWPEFTAAYLRYRVATYELSPAGEAVDAEGFPCELARIARRVYRTAGDSPRAASYALVGSQNMDYRGMFMDGEVDVLYGGYDSLVPLLDLLFLEGTATWVEDTQALDALLPPPTALQRRLSRVVKDAM